MSYDRFIQSMLNNVYIFTGGLLFLGLGMILDITDGWYPVGLLIAMGVALCLNIRWALNG